MKAIKFIILATVVALAACKSDNKDNLSDDEKKEMETVSDQIRRDSLRADSAFKAMQKRMNEAELDTSVKLEPGK